MGAIASMSVMLKWGSPFTFATTLTRSLEYTSENVAF